MLGLVALTPMLLKGQLSSASLSTHSLEKHVKAGSTSWGPWWWCLALGMFLAAGTLSYRNRRPNTAPVESQGFNLASGPGTLGPSMTWRGHPLRGGGGQMAGESWAQSLKTWTRITVCHLPPARMAFRISASSSMKWGEHPCPGVTRMEGETSQELPLPPQGLKMPLCPGSGGPGGAGGLPHPSPPAPPSCDERSPPRAQGHSNLKHASHNSSLTFY